MTNKEKALIYFKDLRARKVEDYSSVFDTAPKDSVVYGAVSAEIEMYDAAIKALEQEPILDKIRAEIAEYGSIWVEYAITKDTKTDKGIEKLVNSVLKQAKEQVLQTIDKYKAETEG